MKVCVPVSELPEKWGAQEEYGDSTDVNYGNGSVAPEEGNASLDVEQHCHAEDAVDVQRNVVESEEGGALLLLVGVGVVELVLPQGEHARLQSR